MRGLLLILLSSLLLGACAKSCGSESARETKNKPAPQTTTGGKTAADAASPGEPARDEGPPLDRAKRIAYLTELAVVHERYERLDKAEELLLEALHAAETSRDKVSLHEQISALYKRKGQLEEAISHIEGALQAATDDRTKARMKRLIADLYVASGQHDRADGMFESFANVTKTANDYQIAANELMVSHFDSRTIDALLERFHKKLQDNPKDVWVLRVLATAHQHDGRQPDKAIEFWVRLLELRPNDDLAMHNLRTLYVQQGFPAKAREVSEAFIKMSDPNNPLLSTHISGVVESMLKAGQKKEARALVETWLGRAKSQHFKRDLRAWLQKIVKSEGKLKDLESSLAAQVDKDKNREAVQALAQLYEDQQRFADVARMLEILLEIAPEDRDTTERLVQTYSLLGRPKEAARVYERRIKADPERKVEILLQMANFLASEARFDEARAVYRRLVEADPDNSHKYTKEIDKLKSVR